VYIKAATFSNIFLFNISFFSSSSFVLNTRLTKSGLFYASSVDNKCSFISGHNGLYFIIRKKSGVPKRCTKAIASIYRRRISLGLPVNVTGRKVCFLILEASLSPCLKTSRIPCKTSILNKSGLKEKKSSRCVSSFMNTSTTYF